MLYKQPIQVTLFTIMAHSSQEHTKFTLSAAEILANWLYSSLIAVLTPLLVLHWATNSLLKKPGFGSKRLSRFGFIPRKTQPTSILIHCVSVGEVNIAASIVKRLSKLDPKLTFTLTTTTPTGAENVKRLLGDAVQHLYLPIDLELIMGRLLKRISPQQIMIVEVELWPNLLRQASRLQIPVTVVNARMTNNSVKGYQKMGLLFQPMLRSLHKVLAQGQRDYHNYLLLGLPEDKCFLTGNLKFDLDNGKNRSTNSSSLIDHMKIDGRIVIVGGSTHDPEESILLDAFKMIKERFPRAILFIVPRHPQRFSQVHELCSESTLNTVRLSDKPEITDNTQIVLVDAMGLLNDVYKVSKIAFIGGSIADKGGHNALEAVKVGVPVLMGENQYNNPEIASTLRQEGCLINVATAKDIAKQCLIWLEDEEMRQQAAQSGLDVIQRNQGALDNTLIHLGFGIQRQ